MLVISRMKKKIFGKRFLAVNLPSPLVVTFCYFTRAGRALTLMSSGKFSFGVVFLVVLEFEILNRINLM